MSITEPGVYEMSMAEYLADRALSCSGARKLLPPSCPALYQHYIQHGEEAKAEWDFGSAAHTFILGTGPSVTVVKADNWTTKAAREERDAARACGSTPVLLEEWNRVQDMAEVLSEHSYAMQLLSAPGEAESSLFWTDPVTGVMCRARPDYLHANGEIIVDYKTAVSAEPKAIAAAMWRYGYYQSAPWYQDAVVALGLPEYFPEFVFIFQEKTAPYLVTVVSPDEEMLSRGRQRNRRAIDVFHRCKTFDHWPGYSDGPITVSLPGWAIRELDSSTEMSW